MEYIALKTMPYYEQCSSLVDGMGYSLVSIKVIPAKGQMKVEAVITYKENISDGIGINDCAKVHRLLLPRVEALLQGQDVYMEVTSPGMERHIKNAAEFILFKGKNLKVWDVQLSDWIQGKVVTSDDSSLTLEIMENSQTRVIPYEQIAKAKLLQS